jgi:hypothetical protein
MGAAKAPDEQQNEKQDHHSVMHCSFHLLASYHGQLFLYIACILSLPKMRIAFSMLVATHKARFSPNLFLSQ